MPQYFKTMRKVFKAPWDFKLIAITSGIIILFAALNYATPNIYVAVLLWSIVIGCSVFGVYGYSIQDGKLKILCLGWAKEIKMSDITRVESKPNAMLGSIRKFGIGGLFGYIGKFSNTILGSYTAYATHTEKTVEINTKQTKYIITPDNPDEFVTSLRTELKI